MKNEKCGVYQIKCGSTNEVYVGSSVRMYTRWSEHRGCLRKGRHTSHILQKRWNKYGESGFHFSILEECSREHRFAREQFWIDELNPALNSWPVVCPVSDLPNAILDKRAATLRARAALITHCPRGHPYDAANTYRNKKGKRICRACNALRVAAVYASETPERTAERLRRNMEYHNLNRDERLAKQREYVAAHKEEKREYDRLRRERLKAAGWQRGQPQSAFI